MKLIHLDGKQISTQHAYGQSGKIRYMKKEAKALKDYYIRQVKEQWNSEKLEGELVVEICLVFGDKIKRDWDNYHKLTMDAMEGIVFEDDSQITDAKISKEYRKGQRLTLISIGGKK